MLNQLLIFLLLFILSINCRLIDKGYLATFPTSVLPGTEVPFCIRFFNLTGEILIKIEDNRPNSFSPLRKIISATNETCFKFHIRKLKTDVQTKSLSLTGETLDGKYLFRDLKTFIYKKTSILTFIETDKPVYKNGQKVRIRILTIDYQLNPVNKTFQEIYIQDSTDTRVFQWLNVRTRWGLASLDLPIPDEPNYGIWKITANKYFKKDTAASATFEVKKYVLPTFELQLKTPSYVLKSDKNLNVKACAKYSHGKSVKGKLSLKIFLKTHYELEIHEDPSFQHTQELIGCETINFELEKLGIPSEEFDDIIDINGEFIENDTNATAQARTEIKILQKRYNVHLLQPSYYKPGLLAKIMIKIANPDETPVFNKTVSIKIEMDENAIYEKNHVSDENGLLWIYYDAPACSEIRNCKRSKSLKIRANIDEDTYKYLPYYKQLESSSNVFTLHSWYSGENTYLHIYKPNLHEPIDCNKNISFDLKIRSNQQLEGNLFLQITSRANVTLTGSYNISSKEFISNIGNESNFTLIEEETKTENYTTIKSFKLSFSINEEMSPELRIIAFCIINGEIVSDSVTIKINKCLKNNVNFSINKKSVNVGEDVILRLDAVPNSLCALSALDKSVTYMGRRNSIDKNKVFAHLSMLDLVTDNIENNIDTGICIYDHYRKKRSFIHETEENPFQEAKLILLTDLEIYKKCHEDIYYDDIAEGELSEINEDAPASNRNEIPVVNLPSKTEDTIKNVVRNFFPETWLWDIQILNENGSIEFTKKTPDSLTDWIFDAYCLSKENSIGIAPPATLNVLQPFFVSINLPYSAVRGEIIPVQASVFNYMDKCIPIRISFISEKQILIKNDTSNSVTMCVCSDEKVTHVFQAIALEFDNEIGVNVTVKATITNETHLCGDNNDTVIDIEYSDTEIRSVIVEPEGIGQEIVKNIFIVLNDTKIDGSFEVNLPKNIVYGSTRAYLSVIGDPMGPAINNLEHLVALPTGCGEQNMIRFAPLVSITKYLKDTQQLTVKVADLAREYIKIGYQRQLSYRHSDGSFSAFGKHDQLGGGTWLTAFVLQCFSKSFESNIIKIDQDDIDITFNWLLKIQKEDGSFPNVGTPLLSKGLSGGLDDNKNIGLSAYVLISLLTAIRLTDIKAYNKTNIDEAIVYLKNNTADYNNTDIYTLALVAYAFKLANESQVLVDEIENELNKRAIKDGDMIHWKQIDLIDGGSEIRSADIEITSYILLAKLYNLNDTNVETLLPIVKWLNSKRNSLGGFYSTQDTVVALDALSRFSSQFYSKTISLRVAYSFNEKLGKPLIIHQKNRLLLQKVKLLEIDENKKLYLNYSINGTGASLLQLSVKYNTKNEEIKSKEKSFELEIESHKKPDCKTAVLTINTKYIGINNASSMAIVDLRLPTGWTSVEDSVKKLINDTDVRLKRYEISENKIALYFDEIKKVNKIIQFEINKYFEVENSKPGIISVYDYYEPQDSTIYHEFNLTCD